MSEPRKIVVALVGNPNTGKSTLFNALCGVHQRVGNYPGVTVEKKVGRLEFEGRAYTIVDLPGTYSLAPRSPDEMVAVDVLLGRRDDVDAPDAVVCIVDASNLPRNLYLVSQVLELGRPTVLALNMTDVAAECGLSLDIDRLRDQLNVPVVELQAHKRLGLSELKASLSSCGNGSASTPDSPFPLEFQREVGGLQQATEGNGSLPRYLLERLLLDTSGYLAQAEISGVDEPLLEKVKSARSRLADSGHPIPAVEAISRYAWVEKVLDGVVARPAERQVHFSDRMDRLLTHRVWGTLIFLLLMILLFQSVFYVAEPASAGIDWLVGKLGGMVAASMAEGALRSLLISGVIEGMGSVLVFLPQILALFLFIAILEDCGYMARAAYLVDRLMSRVGLSGKSFIPLLSSFACAIPGIMAARVIENRRDRLVTILVAPLMSCSARLPVYTLLIAAFIPNTRIGGLLGLQGITMFAMYSIGIVTAIGVALVLKKTILKGPTPPFVMELPMYKLPLLSTVVYRMFDRGWAFVRRAGTLILAAAIVVWAAAYYPHDRHSVDSKLLVRQSQLEHEIEQLETDAASQAAMEPLRSQLAQIEHDIDGELLTSSYLGRAGRFIEPAVRPLGWDWKIGCAAIASFPAREVIVATLGVLYHQGGDVSEESASLRESLKRAKWDGTDRPVFNIPVALSIMVFFALCAQCVSTLAVMWRETNSWRWPVFTFVYMTALAYLGALTTYQLGMLFVA